MKEKYEKTVLNVTRFTKSDVIATSEIDRNNAYRQLGDLESSGRTPLIDR